jgi:hypothetical protein
MIADTSPDFDWLSVRPEFHACIHEAGHAVAARAFGYSVAWVSIDPEFLRTAPLAIENDCTAGNPVAMVLASDIISPILQRGFTRSEEERRWLDGYCIETLAGPMVEQRKNPFYDDAVAARDFAQVTYVLSKTEKDKFRRKRRLRTLLKSAEAFIDASQLEILCVASALYQHRTIEGDEELDRIIRGAPNGKIAVPFL